MTNSIFTDRLSQRSLSLPLHATHITLLVPHISLFPLANQAYSTWFGVSPPSRATVAVPLPEEVGVRVEVIGFDDRLGRAGEGSKEGKIGGRSSLHVQSLSYWAPANIGPYSQAITVSCLVLHQYFACTIHDHPELLPAICHYERHVH